MGPPRVLGRQRAGSTAWLASGFGFDVAAYAGPETGVRDRVSYLLQHGDIRVMVTAGLSKDSEVGKHVLEHGDGVRNLAWQVPDPAAALESATRRGAREVQETLTVERDEGAVTTAAIEAYGDTRHVFVDRSRWRGTWGPGFSAERLPLRPVGRPPLSITSTMSSATSKRAASTSGWSGTRRFSASKR